LFEAGGGLDVLTFSPLWIGAAVDWTTMIGDGGYLPSWWLVGLSVGISR
jgi:hypothetical protein